jgi:hypothetical protein
VPSCRPEPELDGFAPLPLDGAACEIGSRLLVRRRRVEEHRDVLAHDRGGLVAANDARRRVAAQDRSRFVVKDDPVVDGIEDRFVPVGNFLVPADRMGLGSLAAPEGIGGYAPVVDVGAGAVPADDGTAIVASRISAALHPSIFARMVA